jgi:myo-inositol-1(or 4)-monophosphatase
MNRSHEEFIESVARQAGEIIQQHYEKRARAKEKTSRIDVVTEADTAAEKIIIDRIKTTFPDHNIIAEESGYGTKQSTHTWVVDPLDGTKNFSVHIPIFGVAIALLESDTVVEAGIYLPVLNEFVYARKGHGTYMNGEKLHASTYATLADSVGIMNSWTTKAEKFKEMHNILSKAHRCMFTTTGSHAATGVYLCTGRADWVVSDGAALWDYAPIALILQEAGYTVTDKQGQQWKKETKSLVAANKDIHKQLIEAIQQ